MQPTKIESSNIYMTVLVGGASSCCLSPAPAKSDDRRRTNPVSLLLFSAGSHVQFRFPCEVAAKVSSWKYLHGFNKHSEMKKIQCTSASARARSAPPPSIIPRGQSAVNFALLSCISGSQTLIIPPLCEFSRHGKTPVLSVRLNGTLV